MKIYQSLGPGIKQTWPNKPGKTNLAFSQKDKQLIENRWEIHQILSIISSQRFTMVPFYKKGVKFAKTHKKTNKLGQTNLAFSQKEDKQLNENRWEIHHIITTHNGLG